jgi:hypothetical protein
MALFSFGHRTNIPNPGTAVQYREKCFLLRWELGVKNGGDILFTIAKAHLENVIMAI